MTYFSKCKTEEEAKQLFRQLSFKLHPDSSISDGKEFIDMTQQYRNFVKFKQGTNFNEISFKNIVEEIITKYDFPEFTGDFLRAILSPEFINRVFDLIYDIKTKK